MNIYKEGIDDSIKIIDKHFSYSNESLSAPEYHRIQMNLYLKLKNPHYASNKEEIYNNSILVYKSILHSLRKQII